MKGSRIADVCDDLGRALGVGNLRIVMSLPGTTSMGLEMPSANRQTVRISEILASEEFTNSKSKLSLALGKDIAGNPYVVDLAKMPHLLVAGTTGSGKSESDPQGTILAAKRSMADHVQAMLAFHEMGVPTFDYGNNIRQMAQEVGVSNAFDFPGFVPAYIRPLFCRGIGPSGHENF